MNNPETHVTLGTRQCFTKEALEKTKGTVKHEQSRDTCNIGHKTMFYKRSLRENQRAIKNVQSRDTGNIWHKTMFYKISFRENRRGYQEWTIQITEAIFGTRQCFTKEVNQKAYER